ncbi:hypothetical protein D1007_44743 [Hordeum vulgare]|nr:hypothetical protein D1007_44743 [Hordeum vulgare]
MGDVAAASKRRRDGPESPAMRHDTSLDHISRLPDEILGTIISLIPDTKDAGRTTVLSSRWRHLWRSAPLNLAVNRRLSKRKHDCIAIVSKILAAHRGPARRLSLGAIRLSRDRYAKFDGWFQSSALNGLQELDFSGCFNQPAPLPRSALRFATTLQAVSIHACDFRDVDDVCFPRLKQLKLSRIIISETALCRLITSCTALQSLELHGIREVGIIRIISSTLRSIGVSAWSELVIEDAPCLERLISRVPFGLFHGQMKVRVIAAPKLKVLGCLTSQISELVIGSVIIKEMILVSFTMSVRTVKVLAVEFMGPNLDAILGFLRCFPCLEKLYIHLHLNMDMKNVRQHDTLVDPIECLDLHLGEIVLYNYQGKKRHVDFARFFVLNARVLKTMKFGVYGTGCNKIWMANQHRQLQLDNRASCHAQFDFKRNYVTSSSFSHNNKHIYDT